MRDPHFLGGGIRRWQSVAQIVAGSEHPAATGATLASGWKRTTKETGATPGRTVTPAVSEPTADSSVARAVLSAFRQPMSRFASLITPARSSGRGGAPSLVSDTGASFGGEAIRLWRRMAQIRATRVMAPVPQTSLSLG